MERVATFAWQTPPPSSVDESLVLYDDGRAWLVVRRPRSRGAAIGSYVAQPAKDDLAALAGAGPGPITFELLHADPTLTGLMSVADRVAADARDLPMAVATFYGQSLGAAGGRLRMSLAVVAAGERAVQFDLDPAACAVHFSREGEALAWYELPPPETGFITEDAEGLGGLGRRAIVPPGEWGAISLLVPAPPGPADVSVQVAGWLYEALPDEPTPARFEVRTDRVPAEASA
jgi:hypothetical protein